MSIQPRSAELVASSTAWATEVACIGGASAFSGAVENKVVRNIVAKVAVANRFSMFLRFKTLDDESQLVNARVIPMTAKRETNPRDPLNHWIAAVLIADRE